MRKGRGPLILAGIIVLSAVIFVIFVRFMGHKPPAPAAQPPPQPSPFLKIAAPNGSSGPPQIVVETSLPPGTAVDITVFSQPGRILKYYNFNLKRSFKLPADRRLTVDLSAEHLPSGDYSVTARAGDMNAFTTLPVGSHDELFNKQLAIFRKQFDTERLSEAKILVDGVSSTDKSLRDLTLMYKKALTAKNKDKKKWNKDFLAWRQGLEKTAKNLRGVGEANRKQLVLFSLLSKLKAANDKLAAISKAYDQAIKSSRPPLNVDKDISKLKALLGDLQEEAGHFKQMIPRSPLKDN